MSLSIRQKLLGLAGIGAAVALFGAGQGRLALEGVRAAVEGMGVAATAAQNQTEADMLHDGLRGDVYFALLARKPEDIESARKDVTEHAAWFRRLVDENAALDLPGSVRTKIAALRPVLDRYIASAGQMIELAASNRARALEELTAFEQAFTDLEGPMEALSDDMLAVSTSARDAKDARIAAASRSILAVGMLGALAVAALAFWLARSITSALDRTVGALQQVAEGNLGVTLAVASDDELGRMALALNQAVASVRATVSGILQNAGVLSSAADDLSNVTDRIGGAAESASQQAGLVSHATEQINASIQTVASAMEEMHASTREIAKNAGDAARVAGEAVEIAGTTTRTVARLDESSRNVEKVIKVITSISQQTNLLALNATIEAARAGEAGKGFAVVAKEVKELATETGRATEEIGRMIAAIQGDTGDSVAAIEQISQIIHEISGLQTTIAGAVEQQSAASHQIALNVHDAARGSAEIASGIMRVADTATDTSASVHEGQKATESLTRMARDLHDVVSRFRL